MDLDQLLSKIQTNEIKDLKTIALAYEIKHRMNI